LPVFILSFLGLVFGKFRKIDLSSISEYIIYVATPCLILSSLSKKHIDIVIAGNVLVSVCLIMLFSSVIAMVIIKKLDLHYQTYLPPVLFANTGNMGLPIVYYAFGDEGLTIAILYMVSTTILHYSAGIMIFNLKRSPFELLKLPLIYSAVLGLVISVSGIKLPLSIDRAVTLAGEASIPTMIFALGYKLADLKITNIPLSLLFGSLRIFLGAIFALLVVHLLGIKDLVANVIILQATMPPAVFNFVLAAKYNLNSQIVASVILAGTLISIITLPLIIAYLI
jgi:malate permease and related proteins